ncbi:MAG: DUF2322 family protein [Pseudomonadota bacterium]
MTNFAEILPTLPAVDGIAHLELIAHDSGDVAAVIENKPGQAGSLRVYHALWQKHGSINAAAAEEGLALYAEHTPDARAHPGKHPNIDRLLQVMEQNLRYDVRIGNQVV